MKVISIVIDFSAITRDSFHRVVPPSIVLKQKYGGTIASLGIYKNLSMELKYNEVSSGKFEYPAYLNLQPMPFYDDIKGGRIVQIDPYGVFILTNLESNGDGLTETKTCSFQSLEYELSEKSITLEAGTYKFYDLTNPFNPDTMVGRILEKTRNWKFGAVSKSLWNKYRTFDDTEEGLHSFMMGTLQKSYNCVFNFDTYTRTINVLDADEDVPMLTVYLSYNNLIKEVTITEVDDNLFTKVSVHGSDPLNIRDVNPIGSNYIYSLDYFISEGDIPAEVAQKWRSCQANIRTNQAYYSSMAAMQNSLYSRYLAATAKLADLNGELASLDNLRSVNTQGLAIAEQQSDIDHYERRLSEIAEQYRAKENEISAQEELVDALLQEYKTIGADIEDLVASLSINNNFSSKELDLLDHYFIEGDFVDSTFAVFDVDIGNDSSSFSNITDATVSMAGVSLLDVALSGVWACRECTHHFSASGTPTACPKCGSTRVYAETPDTRRIFDISGGQISITGRRTVLDENGATTAETFSIRADISRATLDHKDGSDVVFSVCLGAGTVNDSVFPSGNLTVSCSASFDDDAFLSGFDRIVETTTDAETGVIYEDVHYEGGNSFSTSDGSVYFTRDVTESQRFYVAQELYDYAVDQLKDISCPTYSFELSTANPLFAKEFSPFKDSLRLGSGCYLKLKDDLLTKQMLLEIHLDFEDPTKFKMIFSNEFKRPDKVNTMKQQIQDAAGASKTLDLKKLAYGSSQTSGMYNAVQEFIQQGLDAAATQVLAGKEQNVSVDKRGIKIATVGGKEYLLMADGMIAIIDDQGRSKMALGHFYNTASGQNYYGVLADVIGGDLLVGLQLNITCPDINGGVAQFKVDSSGVFLNNSRFYLQSDGGGKIGLDAQYGIFGGTSSLFEVTDTGFVKPVFIDANGDVVLDKDGFPMDTNFWLDIRTGNVYLRGKVYATDGIFNGTVYAKAGKFSGVVQAADFLDSAGRSMLTANGKFDSNYLDLGNIVLDGTTGDITMMGNLNLSGLSSITWGKSSPVKYQFSVNGSSGWHDTMSANDKYRRDSLDGGATWGSAYQFRGEDGQPGRDGADGIDGEDASVTRANIVKAMLDSIDEDGLYTTRINGRQCLGINATAIKTGILDAIDIHGCRITADSTIDVGTDMTIGNNLYIGEEYGGTKMICFNSTATISSPSQDDISISCRVLDLTTISYINFPPGAVTATFA